MIQHEMAKTHPPTKALAKSVTHASACPNCTAAEAKDLGTRQALPSP